MVKNIVLTGMLFLFTGHATCGESYGKPDPSTEELIRPQRIQVLGPDLDPLINATLYRGEILLGKTDKHGIFTLPDRIQLPVRIRVEHPAYAPIAVDIPALLSHPTVTIQLQRYRTMSETIAVTALPAIQPVSVIPRAQTNLDLLDIQETMPASITDLVQQTTGGSFIGSGGFSTTPSIRGLARRRVLILLDGVRISSDRRAGASASFIPPTLIQSFELIRSSGSVHLGSDAMGGVLSMHTTRPEKPDHSRTEATCHYGTNGSISDLTLRHESVSTSGVQWYLGVWNTESGDYRTPRERIVNSGYMTRTLISGARIDRGDQTWTLRLLTSLGRHIGKPDRENNPDETTTNPYRYDDYLTAGWSHNDFLNRGTLDVLFNVNPFRYQLERVNIPAQQKEVSNTTGFNSTLRLVYTEAISTHTRIRTGIDFYQRNNVRIDNLQESNDGSTFSIPLDGADRLDRGWFLSVRTEPTARTSITAGVRLNHNRISPATDSSLQAFNDHNLAGELGLVYRPTKHISVFLNGATSYRTPSLSETYYTGITGRKWVIGNPELEPETGTHVDTGFRVDQDRWSFSGYLFTYRIRNMIERYRLPDNTYTHDNIQKGTIRGVELFAHYRPLQMLELTGSWTHYSGRAQDGTPLNDVPAARAEFVSRLYAGHWSGQLAWLHVTAKTDPGPAESPTTAFSSLQLRFSYFVSRELQLYVKMSNLNNRFFYTTADPDIPAAPGRAITVGIRMVKTWGHGE